MYGELRLDSRLPCLGSLVHPIGSWVRNIAQIADASPAYPVDSVVTVGFEREDLVGLFIMHKNNERVAAGRREVLD